MVVKLNPKESRFSFEDMEEISHYDSLNYKELIFIGGSETYIIHRCHKPKWSRSANPCVKCGWAPSIEIEKHLEILKGLR